MWSCVESDTAEFLHYLASIWCLVQLLDGLERCDAGCGLGVLCSSAKFPLITSTNLGVGLARSAP